MSYKICQIANRRQYVDYALPSDVSTCISFYLRLFFIEYFDKMMQYKL